MRTAFCCLAIALLAVFPSTWALAQTPITTCGTNITTAGFYFLPSQIDCSQTANQVAIAVNASGVDLNLNGQTIIGSPVGGNAVAVALGTTATDCSLATGAIANVRVHGVMATMDISTAIIACQTSNSIFDHVTIDGPADGIVLEEKSNNNFVLANTITASDIGIQIGANNDGSDSDTTNSIEGNTIITPSKVSQSPSPPETAGILLYTGATETQVTANTVMNGWLNGIDLRRCASPVGHSPCDSGPSGNFLQQNISNGNITGIRLSGAAGNRIQDNNAKNNQTGKDMAGVIDDNNSAPRKPCANTWVDNFYDGKLGKLRCIPGSKRNSVSGN
jgi:parallel beta-helix repeat protein